MKVTKFDWILKDIFLLTGHDRVGKQGLLQLPVM